MMRGDIELIANQSPLINLLKEELMLSECEAIIYLLLAKKGSLKAIELARCLKVNKVIIYRDIKSLESKNMVECIMGHPARFIATPLKRVLNLHINNQKSQLHALEKKVKSVYCMAELNNIEKSFKDESDRLVILEGVNRIRLKAVQMLREAKKERVVIYDKLGPFIQDAEDYYKRLLFEQKNMIQSKLLTNLSSEELAIAKTLLPKSSWQFRHGEISQIYFSTLLITDEEQMLLIISNRKNNLNHPISKPFDKAMWTNNIAIVMTMKGYFENLWNSSMDVKARIAQLESSNQ
jgi:sugar-specific transcriptional regulator TrmB